jgi:hypothetical protein
VWVILYSAYWLYLTWQKLGVPNPCYQES